MESEWLSSYVFSSRVQSSSWWDQPHILGYPPKWICSQSQKRRTQKWVCCTPAMVRTISYWRSLKIIYRCRCPQFAPRLNPILSPSPLVFQLPRLVSNCYFECGDSTPLQWTTRGRLFRHGYSLVPLGGYQGLAKCIITIHDRCSCREMGYSLWVLDSCRICYADGVNRLVVMMVIMTGLWALVPSHPDRRDD